MSRGITAIALRGCAAAFVVAIGCGVQTAAHSGMSIPEAAAMAEESGQAAPPDPQGTGATPVVPVHGGCISGLNCGCIRGTGIGPCAGPPLVHHPPTPPNVSYPQNARAGAAADPGH
jgi:hypothetical protein